MVSGESHAQTIARRLVIWPYTMATLELPDCPVDDARFDHLVIEVVAPRVRSADAANTTGRCTAWAMLLMSSSMFTVLPTPAPPNRPTCRPGKGYQQIDHRRGHRCWKFPRDQTPSVYEPHSSLDDVDLTLEVQQQPGRRHRCARSRWAPPKACARSQRQRHRQGLFQCPWARARSAEFMGRARQAAGTKKAGAGQGKYCPFTVPLRLRRTGGGGQDLLVTGIKVIDLLVPCQ